MKKINPTKNELNNDETPYRHGDIEPKLEWLNETSFKLNKIQIAFIKTTFEADRKTKLFVQDPDIFNEFILSINALIRKYHSIKNRSKDFNQESESIAKIGDWLKDLDKAEKTLKHIDQSESIASQLQILLFTKMQLQTQNQETPHLIRQRSLVDMKQDISCIIQELNHLEKAMHLNVKSGRPKVDDMRSWFICELAQLYKVYLKSPPSLTQDNSFHHLVDYLLEIIDDPLKDSFGAIKKALNKNGALIVFD